MDSERWQKIGEIFDAVSDSESMRHSALLEALCGDDVPLRAAVQALLDADARAARFDTDVEVAREDAAQTWAEAIADEGSHIGERVGPWRLDRELGRGGMGVVFLAQRADEHFQQLAALKLIKRGMDSDAVHARFLRERQILARLEHPRIARLLDGGIASDGRPYFAMEFVDGEPLLQYCERSDATLDQRLRIFIDICSAVQFAHAQLIVHRDLKPSNVLITADGSVKLLDFGVAKLLGTDESGPATGTLLWQDNPLTLAYAAPEQLRGEPVSTSTDIYALGCILYELLTGSRPFAMSDAPSMHDLRRVLEATGPLPPSRQNFAAAPIAPRRLRGDLDTIALTALKREPHRRYATVEAFAHDVQRYRDRQPIVARRDQPWYRVGKFIGRHRIAVGASALGLGLLLVALSSAIWQARAKTREAQASQQVTQFMVGMFDAADPTHSRGARLSAQDLLDQSAQQLRSQLSTEPEVRARLEQTVAASYMALGLYDRAQPLAQSALALRRNALDARDPQVAQSIDQLGQLYVLTGHFDLAEPLLREALALREANLAADDPAVIDSLGNLGLLLQNRGEFAAADVPFRAALTKAEHRFGSGATETARRIDDLATNIANMGKPVDATALFRDALAIRERNLGVDDPEVATSLQNLGVMQDQVGSIDAATKSLQRALQIRTKTFGADHPLVGYTQLALASIYDSQGDPDLAEHAANEALRIFRNSVEENHPKVSEALNMLAVLRTTRRDYAGAATLFREVRERFRRADGDDHPDTLTATNNLAVTLTYAGYAQEAEQLHREVLARAGADNGQPVLVSDCENLSLALQRQGKFLDALKYARRGYDLEKQREGAASANTAIALRGVALAEELSGDSQSAERDFRVALGMGEAMAAKQGIATYVWKIPLADLLVGKNRCDEAIPLLNSASAELATIHGTYGQFWKPELLLLKGNCLAEGSSRGEAQAMMDSARTALRALAAVDVDLYPTSNRLLAENPAAAGKKR